jgi:hypothetical protein
MKVSIGDFTERAQPLLKRGSLAWIKAEKIHHQCAITSQFRRWHWKPSCDAHLLIKLAARTSFD